MSFMKYNKALKSGILLKNSLISILKSQKEGLATSLEGNKIIHDVGFAGYSSMVKGSNAFHTRIAKSVKDGAQSLFRGRHIRENRVSLLTPNQLNKCFGGHPMHPCFTRSLASTSAPQPSGQTHQQVVMRSCTTSATQQGSGNGKTNFMSTQNRPLMGGSTGYPNANVEDSALGFDKRESPKDVVHNHGWDDVEKLKAELRGQKGFIGRSINSIQPPEEQNKKDFIVHFRSIRNNAFVTVTDAKGNKKIGASAGSLEEFKGGARLSRYAAQACAEHVGRISRNLGMTSVVMKVKGFTFFGKKKKTILSWREGYTSGFGGADLPRIVSIRDVTQLPHNGCRLPKKRRI